MDASRIGVVKKLALWMAFLILFIFTLSICSSAFAFEESVDSAIQPRMTYTQFYFDFQKGDIHLCGPAQKASLSTSAYAEAYDGDIYFEENGSRMGSRMVDVNGNSLTQRQVITKLNTSYVYSYYSTPVLNTNTYFRATVDDDSTTQWIRIWGYYQP